MVIKLDDGDGADWIKARSWDLPVNPDYYIARYPNLRAWLDHIDNLPTGKAMPGELRQALEAHISSSDTESNTRERP
jgi:hypothetical protein